ncbi:hypothetical protein [Methylomusa anaerophila]|uniref:hypothetical protein n=1 Tax=Methylomusa anaerophila TaxID=1930071 RepID=UPI001315097B|nr:hypothetical protein [Methylomusa anaerophila]
MEYLETGIEQERQTAKNEIAKLTRDKNRLESEIARIGETVKAFFALAKIKI